MTKMAVVAARTKWSVRHLDEHIGRIGSTVAKFNKIMLVTQETGLLSVKGHT
jgi:hypothetical protein